MEKMPEDPKELRYSLQDFWKVCKRSKRLIWTSMLIGALICSGYALTRPVYYLSIATFRDKGRPHTSIGGSLSEYLFNSGSPGADSEAMSTLKSRKLLSRVISKLGVQALIVNAETRYPDLEDFRDNLLGEYAHWRDFKHPLLKELDKPLNIKKVRYEGEYPIMAVIEFTDDTHFKWVDRPNLIGELGKPYEVPEFAFELSGKNEETALKGSYYAITFFPMELATKIYGALLVLEPDREDKTLLKLQYRHRDRHLSSNFINTLMATYQDYLKEDNELTSSHQLNYLKSRQDEMGGNLQTLLQNHASRISSDLSSSGFMDSEKEMDFLASNLHGLQQKQTEIDFETKRLYNLKDFDCVHYDQYGGRGDSSIINSLLGEIRGLRQEIDLLDLSLQIREKRDDESVKILLAEQFNELQETQKHLKEAQEMAVLLTSKDKNLSLINPPQYLTVSWNEALTEKSFESAEEEEQFRLHFFSYIENLMRLLKLKEATIQERIKHQHASQGEFQGITLDTARNLFMNYTRELNEAEALIKQHNFVIQELQKSDFEVCSLTALLHDPISAERIGKASMLLISLKDENNRTQKELTRIREELELLKKFLAAHLNQMVELLNLKQSLLQEKTFALQSLMLDLSQQRIYVLKKQLSDYVATRLDNLSHEKLLLKDYQMDLGNKMAKIPGRWAAEKIVSQHLSIHQKFLENLSNMVESKNIAKNLEIVQSMPLDAAITPVNPKPPRAVFYAIVGAFFGLMCSVGYLITNSLIRGVFASGENLRLANIHYSGSISQDNSDSPLLDRDLDTLRRLLGYFQLNLKAEPNKAKKVLITQPKGQDFSFTLATLIAKKGQKVLVLPLSFDTPGNLDQPGLLQYLEEGTTLPVISARDGVDYLFAGGISRFSAELLRRPRFSELLADFDKKYEWIIGVTHASILTAEAANLNSLFEGSILVLTDETIESVKAFTEEINKQETKVISVVIQDG